MSPTNTLSVCYISYGFYHSIFRITNTDMYQDRRHLTISNHTMIHPGIVLKWVWLLRITTKIAFLYSYCLVDFM